MTQQDALRKAMACLRLAKSSNPAEAALAAAKAQEIMDRYELSIDDIDFDAQQKERDTEEVKSFGYADPLDNVKYGNYRESWTQRLASTVAQHNGVRTFWAKNSSTAKDGISIRVVGKPSDVETTRYLYGFFKRQIEEMQLKEGKGHSSAWKGEFAVGCIDTLRERLKAQREATIKEAFDAHAGNSMALVRVQGAVARIEAKLSAVDKWMQDQVKARELATAKEAGFDTVEAYEAHKTAELEAAAKSAGFKSVNAYLKDLYKGCGGGGNRGFSGAGSKVSTDGRAAGQKAGHNIKLTGSKGGLGSGRKEIQ